jgi:hydrogenase/urease accessory protein HupE
MREVSFAHRQSAPLQSLQDDVPDEVPSLTSRLLPALPLVAGLTSVVLLGVVLILAQEWFLSHGTRHWLFGLDHFGALILIGIWAGRRQAPTLWSVPLSLLIGTVLGLLLGGLVAPPGPGPADDRPFFLLLLVWTVVLSVAILLFFLFSPLNVTRALAALAMAHGYTDSSEMGQVDLATFVVGYATGATLLLTLGVLVGREIPGRR